MVRTELHIPPQPPADRTRRLREMRRPAPTIEHANHTAPGLAACALRPSACQLLLSPPGCKALVCPWWADLVLSSTPRPTAPRRNLAPLPRPQEVQEVPACLRRSLVITSCGSGACVRPLLLGCTMAHPINAWFLIAHSHSEANAVSRLALPPNRPVILTGRIHLCHSEQRRRARPRPAGRPVFTTPYAMRVVPAPSQLYD